MEIYVIDGKVYVIDGKIYVIDRKVYVIDGKIYVIDGKVYVIDGKVYVYVIDGKDYVMTTRWNSLSYCYSTAVCYWQQQRGGQLLKSKTKLVELFLYDSKMCAFNFAFVYLVGNTSWCRYTSKHGLSFT